MWLTDTIFLVAGLAILGAGGEILVRGAARLARLLGLSTLVIGLTIVAFGTSTPEAAVTVFAAAQGQSDIAVGNVVGSNIANILLIAAIAALVRPLAVAPSLLRFDGLVMLVTSAILAGVTLVGGHIGRLAGVAFVCGLVLYTAITLRWFGGPLTGEPTSELRPGLGRHWWYNLALVVAGIAGLLLGARLIVTGAVGLATALGVAPHVVGLTIVAVGTSLPELATSVAAARQRQPHIALGNVVGSNTFNVLFVSGAAAIVRPLVLPGEVARLDIPLMLGVSVLFYIMLLTGRRLSRIEGAVLLALYVGYLIWLTSRSLAS